jgi:Helix-turn-helix domain
MPETKNQDAGPRRRGDIPKGRLLNAVLSQPVRRLALRHLLRCEGLGLNELARELRVPVNEIRYHVIVLRSHGMATGTWDPRSHAEPSCFAATCKEEIDVVRRLDATEVEDREALRERHLAAVWQSIESR